MHLGRWLYKVPLRLRSLFRGRQVEQELDEELQYHLECRIAQEMAGGLSRDEARCAALRAMGGVDQRKEECRDARGLRLFTDLLQDLRYGLRQLQRAPGFAAMAIVTLALGIAACTAVFSLVDTTLFGKLPYRDAGRLVHISAVQRNNPVEHEILARDRFSTLLLAWFAASTLVLAAVGIYSVVAQSVEQRLREIAVRMALGARPDQVMRQVFVRGAVQIGAGLVAGLLGAIATARLLRSLLFQVTPYDPATFAGVLLLLVAVAFLACYGPARRATKVDPLTILRAE